MNNTYKWNCKRFKYRLYQSLNHPRTFPEILYQILLGLLISTCIVLTILLPFGEYNSWKSFANQIIVELRRHGVLYWLDLAILVLLSLEFIARIWSSTILPRYSHTHGLISLILSPIILLDMFMIVSTVFLLASDLKQSVFLVGLRGVRMLQFFENR